MSPVFIAVALMLGVAVLAFVLWPLIRPRPAVGTAVAAAGLVVAAALYVLVGTPAALDPANVRAPETLADAVMRLERELVRNPAQPDGWRLLADAYRAQGRIADAARALSQALRHGPADPELLVQAAEARASTAPGRGFDAQAVAMLERALVAKPDHQRARWFLGIAQRQAGKPAEAAATWEPLLATVDAATLAALRPQIDAARSEAGLPKLPDAQAATGKGLTVELDIDESLRKSLPPGAAVFVIVRQPGGAPMPIAARRIELAALPARMVLTDADSPMPTRRLSQVPRVEVIARASRSGIANAQAGDLETSPATVPNTGAVKLRIDRVRK